MIEEVELNIQHANALVKLGKSLDRLTNNRDFKSLIKDGYFRDEAVRLVHAKANPNTQAPEIQQDIIKQIDAIGNLAAYFRTVGQQAELAKQAIAADEETLQELRNEGAE